MRTIAVLFFCAAALAAADVPRRAPGFALSDYKGQVHDLADYRGRIVVLEFTQSQCPHCANFTTKLNQLQQKYGNRVTVIAVGNPPADSPATLGEYAAGHKIAYPVLFDCGQMAYSYVRTTRIDLPTIFVIDGEGMIRSQYSYGPLTHDIFDGNGLINEIERMLGGRAAPARGGK
jgi:peroxiredoxin